jgi:hypothetical protein
LKAALDGVLHMISLKPIPALGLYLYAQAVEDIGQNLFWCDSQKTSLLLEMAGAIRAGKLCVRDSSTGMPLTVTRDIDSASLVYVSEKDVNAWLQQQRAIYQWSPSMPAKTNPQSPHTRPWVAKARAIGENIWKDPKNKRLSVEQIAKKVHAEMKNQNIVGRGNHVPTADTIKRHALHGIKA